MSLQLDTTYLMSGWLDDEGNPLPGSFRPVRNASFFVNRKKIRPLILRSDDRGRVKDLSEGKNELKASLFWPKEFKETKVLPLPPSVLSDAWLARDASAKGTWNAFIAEWARAVIADDGHCSVGCVEIGRDDLVAMDQPPDPPGYERVGVAFPEPDKSKIYDLIYDPGEEGEPHVIADDVDYQYLTDMNENKEPPPQ